MTDTERELQLVKDELERMRSLCEWQQADYRKIRELQNELHDLEGKRRAQINEIREYKRANEVLVGALSRCRDIIVMARDEIQNDEMRSDISIYLNILEGVITGYVPDLFVRMEK